MSSHKVALFCYLLFLVGFYVARKDWLGTLCLLGAFGVTWAIMRATSRPRSAGSSAPSAPAPTGPEGPLETGRALGLPHTRGPRLVVTGSREGRADVERALDTWVMRYGIPQLVIVGDQRGVDTQAFEWAKERGYTFRRERVRPGQPSPACFHDRNQRMVDWAAPGDYLLAFPTAGSRGTWDCFQRGQRAGLICLEVTTSWFGGFHA